MYTEGYQCIPRVTNVYCHRLNNRVQNCSICEVRFRGLPMYVEGFLCKKGLPIYTSGLPVYSEVILQVSTEDHRGLPLYTGVLNGVTNTVTNVY